MSGDVLSVVPLIAVTTTQAFNPFGELDTDDAQVSSSSVYGNVYTRDKLGRILQKTETIQGATTTYDYHYDLAGRLEQVDENGFVARVYAYDPNGNRLSVTEGAQTTTGTYDAQDRLLNYGTKTYSYNAAGDLTQVVDASLPPGQQTTTYTYDALGNLTNLSLADGRSIEYVIDGQNRRVGKKVNGVLVQGWVYQDQLNPVAELDGAGNVVARFVYGSRPNVPDYMVINGGATYRIVSDHLGSPRLVIDEATGTVAQRLDYDEFGQVISDSNSGFQPFGFAGGIYDPDTRLVRFGARDLDAEVGRWTEKDPIRFDAAGSNLFSYALADPVGLRDPEGRDVVNNSGGPILVLPGSGPLSGSDIVCIATGGKFTGGQDAFAVPGTGTVFKTVDFTNAVVGPGGSVSTSNNGAGLPDPAGPIVGTALSLGQLASGGNLSASDVANNRGSRFQALLAQANSFGAVGPAQCTCSAP